MQILKLRQYLLLLFFFLNLRLEAQSLKVTIAGNAEISADTQEEISIPLSYMDSALIFLKGDTRFFRGIQLDLSAPAAFLAYNGDLALAIYNNLSPVQGKIPETGAAELRANQLSMEALPNKLQNTWQIPLRSSNGLRNSPYVTIPTDVVDPDTFPILFRLMPVIKVISPELEKMVFILNVKPILSDEGAVRIIFTYPQQLPGRPVSVLIDDVPVENPNNELLLKEGEHNLVVLSADYRSQNRRFMVGRAKTTELTVELQDPTPLLVFEYPDAVRIYVDNKPVSNPHNPYPVDPGPHEIRFQMSNYSIIRPVTVQKGKTYRITLSVDINIAEDD
ncbi:MAG: hypothetical protein FWF29_05620 [Treponema sp.]|nr:hypothetical protein [Treponema sp.]